MVRVSMMFMGMVKGMKGLYGESPNKSCQQKEYIAAFFHLPIVVWMKTMIALLLFRPKGSGRQKDFIYLCLKRNHLVMKPASSILHNKDMIKHAGYIRPNN